MILEYMCVINILIDKHIIIYGVKIIYQNKNSQNILNMFNIYLIWVL